MRGNHKHGHDRKGQRTPEYHIWLQMKQRCRNPKHKDYEHYGARGIHVCNEWNDFRIFIQDMGRKPPGQTLERINNNLGYSAANCRWATHKEQCNNSRKNHYIEINGTLVTLKQLSEQTGLNYSTLRSRVYKGYPIEKILYLGKFKTGLCQKSTT